MVWELATPMPYRVLLLGTQSNSWCRFGKVPQVSLELGNLGCCTSSPWGCPGQFLAQEAQIPLRNLCEPTPQAPEPLDNGCCSYLPLQLWNLLSRHPLGLGFWCVNQSHKLCLKPLWQEAERKDDTSAGEWWKTTQRWPCSALGGGTDLLRDAPLAKGMICPSLTKAEQPRVQPNPSPIPSVTDSLLTSLFMSPF